MSVILIADDEVRIRRLVADFLKRDGHTMLEASNGEEAIRLIEQHGEIELAILDVMMPEKDGFSVPQTYRYVLLRNHYLLMITLSVSAFLFLV